jgi:hypothetical protein
MPILPNPCTNCHKEWIAGRGVDCGDFCEDIKAYVQYREMIAAEVKGGLSLTDTIVKVNAKVGRG